MEEHLARVLHGVTALEPLELGLLDAHGCVLAQDVVASAPSPGFDNSAMDGYAVVAADLAGASERSPVELPVVGEARAGPDAGVRVEPGRCVRITTGAPLPEGADAVVPHERTDGGTSTVRVQWAAPAGAHVRRAGEDVAQGDLVLPGGAPLTAATVGLLAALGRGRALVRPRPRVVVVSTGAELVEPGTHLSRGLVPDSNSWALVAAAREAGALATRAPVVPDDPRALRRALDDQLVSADVVLTSGGVSVGAHDVVKQAFGGSADVAFASVAMQPGKPQAAGRLGPDRVHYLGLPGNPVSALVSFEVFVRPLLRTLLGAPDVSRPVVSARALEELRSPPGRRSFLRVRQEVVDGEYAVRALPAQGSHQLAAFARATALAVVPEDTEVVPAGGVVDALLLERRAR